MASYCNTTESPTLHTITKTCSIITKKQITQKNQSNSHIFILFNK